MHHKTLECLELAGQFGTIWMILEGLKEQTILESEVARIINHEQSRRHGETIEFTNGLPDGVLGLLEQNISNVGHAGFVVGSSDGFAVDRGRHDEQGRCC